MSNLTELVDKTILHDLRQIAQDLEAVRIQRGTQDYNFACQMQIKYEQILDENNRKISSLEDDHAIQRIEKSVELQKEISTLSGGDKYDSKAFKDKSLSELIKLEEQDIKDLHSKHLQNEEEFDHQRAEYLKAVDEKREIEDLKTAKVVSRLTGGTHHDKNLANLIVVVDELIAAVQLSAPVAKEDALKSAVLDDKSVTEQYGMATNNTVGLLTPDFTPHSSNETHVTGSQVSATPTHAPRKRSHAAPANSKSTLPVARAFEPALPAAASTTHSLLPSTQARVSVSELEYNVGAKTHRVVIDLTSDTEDEEPVSKRHQTVSFSSRFTALASRPASTSQVECETQAPKKLSKGPILGVFVHKYTPPSSEKAECHIQDTVKDLSLAVKNTTKQLQNVVQPAPVREASPDIFDTDSDYSETESKKCRRNKSCETTRVQSGKLVMGDLLDAPGSDLSFAKGLQWKNWARHVYYPQKFLNFTVKFIWTHTEDGIISKFNDDTHPLGFYFHRHAHTYVPIIGHVNKETVYPEFVLEKDEMEHIQYNSEYALACITRNTGAQSDVLVKFGSRAELWDFLVVTNMEMSILVFENLDLNLPASRLA